jgi:hypothetical protein
MEEPLLNLPVVNKSGDHGPVKLANLLLPDKAAASTTLGRTPVARLLKNIDQGLAATARDVQLAGGRRFDHTPLRRRRPSVRIVPEAADLASLAHAP